MQLTQCGHCCNPSLQGLWSLCDALWHSGTCEGSACCRWSGAARECTELLFLELHHLLLAIHLQDLVHARGQSCKACNTAAAATQTCNGSVTCARSTRRLWSGAACECAQLLVLKLHHLLLTVHLQDQRHSQHQQRCAQDPGSPAHVGTLAGRLFRPPRLVTVNCFQWPSGRHQS